MPEENESTSMTLEQAVRWCQNHHALINFYGSESPYGIMVKAEGVRGTGEDIATIVNMCDMFIGGKKITEGMNERTNTQATLDT